MFTIRRIFMFKNGRYHIFSVHKRNKSSRTELKLDKRRNIEKALEHFDELYGSFYKTLWPSMRLALLSQSKYCALVNYFGDNEQTAKYLQELGTIEIHEIYLGNKIKYQKANTKEKKMFASQEKNKCVHTEEENVENVMSINRVIQPGSGNAALFDFVPASKLKGMEDWVEDVDQLKYYQRSTDFTVETVMDEEFSIPPTLRAFTFPRGDISTFPPPKKAVHGPLNYYLMDAASLLPVLALNIEPFDRVLDMCAAPGGKSLTILQSLYPSILVCNDVSYSRLSRLKNIFHQYLGQFSVWKNQMVIKQCDARQWNENNAFHKVLVDVPCTTDRHSATEEDNNIFKSSRIKERIKLPELQLEILCSGIKACKPGGTVVYSTCTLSPIQNDGVVYMALKELKEKHNIDVIIKDLSANMKPFNFMVHFAPNRLLRYGQLVLPGLPNNYGPMYISKMQRLS